MKKQKLLFLTCCAVFIGLNSIAILREFFLFPVVSILLVVAYLLFFKIDTLLYIMAFVTPFSIIIQNNDVDLGLSLPSEIIMIALTLLFIFRVFYDMKMDKKLITHPVSIAVYIYVVWLFITSITSEYPIVSFKYLASQLWFIIPCYFLVLQLARKDISNIVKYFNCYAVALAIVVVITTIRHATMGFSESSGHWVMSPFYNDHTAYGAILAFMLPVAIGFIFLPNNHRWLKIFYIVLAAIFGVGLFISFSRAAWLSMIGGIGMWIILKLRIRFSWVFLIGLVLGASIFFYADDIITQMSRNTQDSSGNIKEHIQSMSNIKTDASNVERLNRWVSAFGMIEERPFLGWGPGTYKFVYAPFQKGKYKTIISTNFGDGGNAHSEYIGPFAETGIIGFFTVIALVILILYHGIRVYIYSSNKTAKIIALSLVVALTTYFIHGVLNNFLDTDKLALPYWGAFAVIVFLSSYYPRDGEEKLRIND